MRLVITRTPVFPNSPAAVPSCFGDIGGAFALLFAGHKVGDYWIQSDHQATHKALCNRTGRVECAKHVASLTATQAVFLTAASLSTGQKLGARRLAAGLAVNAVSHYIADRRRPIAWLAGRTGKAKFHDMGEVPATGASYLDQAWHVGWLAVSAIIIAGRG